MSLTVDVERYGLLAEFHEPAKLIEAAERTRQAGYRRIDAFAPYPVEHLSEALGNRRTGIPLIVLIGALTGAICGYALQYWVNVIEYPINVGGRPYHSWPAFIPVTFEMAILFGAFSAVFGMLARNGLPMPYHPLFNLEEFKHATQDRFFLCIEAADRLFDPTETRQFLESLGADRVYDVPK